MIDDLREGCGRAVRSGFGSDILGSNAQLLPSEGISTAFKSPRLALYDTRYIPRTIKRRCHVVVGRRYHRAPAAAAASSLLTHHRLLKIFRVMELKKARIKSIRMIRARSGFQKRSFASLTLGI
nr:hypothetical protein CFP56_75795 [Quercus suber]